MNVLLLGLGLHASNAPSLTPPLHLHIHSASPLQTYWKPGAPAVERKKTGARKWGSIDFCCCYAPPCSYPTLKRKTTHSSRRVDTPLTGACSSEKQEEEEEEVVLVGFWAWVCCKEG